MTNDEQLIFFREEISDIQDTIRAQDTKIGFLFAICFLPINQLTSAGKFLNHLPQCHCGKFLIILTFFTWCSSIFLLIYALYPRFNQLKHNIETKEEKIYYLKQEVNNLNNILNKKIKFIQLSLWLMVIWLLLSLIIFFLYLNYN